MLIRTHRNRDIPAIARLYYDTIHRVNSHDYALEQIEAWAPTIPDAAFWKERVSAYRVYVAEEDGHIIGFTELGADGHIDCFFVHHQWQRRGVGMRLMERLVVAATKEKTPRLYAEVSITAKPFFLSQQFVVIKEREAIRRNVKLKQFAMERWLVA